MNPRILPLLLAGTLGLGACAVMPSGPSVMALPGTGKTLTNSVGMTTTAASSHSVRWAA